MSQLGLSYELVVYKDGFVERYKLSAENIVDIQAALRHADVCKEAHKGEEFDDTFAVMHQMPVPDFDY